MYRRTPAGNVQLMLDHLHFANGVSMSVDGNIVLIAETGAARILQVDVNGNESRRSTVFAQNLPGLPDNLSLGSDGLIWTAIVSPMSEQLAKLQRSPLVLRKLISRIPPAFRPAETGVFRVMAFGPDGRCIHDFEGDSKDFHMVTGVREHAGRIYVASIAESAIAYFDPVYESMT